jgi:hypothetical protein
MELKNEFNVPFAIYKAPNKRLIIRLQIDD